MHSHEQTLQTPASPAGEHQGCPGRSTHDLPPWSRVNPCQSSVSLVRRVTRHSSLANFHLSPWSLATGAHICQRSLTLVEGQ